MLNERLRPGELLDDGDEALVGERFPQDPHRALGAFGEGFGGRVFLGGGEDYGDLLGLGHGLEAVARLDAAQLGDRNVHDHEVYPAGEGFLQGRAAIGGRDHAVARALQNPNAALEFCRVVVCDHDSWPAVHGARFYTHFIFPASVIRATSLPDANERMRYTQPGVKNTYWAHER